MDDSEKTREPLLAELAAHRALVDGLLRGIALIDGEGHCLFANPAFATMCGVAAPQDVIGQQMSKFIATEEHARLATYREARLSGGDAPSRYEFQGRRLDGTPVWVEALVSVIDWQGCPTRLFTCIDITERRQAEDEVKQLEAQLRQTQKMEAIGAFASGIAHEFNNTLLHVVMAYIGLAESEIPLSSPAQSYLGEVDAALERVKDLLQQMLTFSRQTTTAYEPLDFAALVQDALRFFRVSIAKTIAIREHIAEEPLTVLADSTQLHQILMNLFANAEYAMRDIGGCLEVRVEALELAATSAAVKPDWPVGAYVRLIVRNTGPGMPAEVREHIFEPFYTTKAMGEGTGMGLAIVHGIVTSHGGRIAVDSQLGEGTTFTIYLPRHAGTAAPAEAVGTPSAGLGRILLVDDEPSLTRVMAGALTRLGYQMVSHTDPEAALAAFEAQPHLFDLLITDQSMPRMTGVQLADQVRQIRADLPIILCTGFSHTIDEAKSWQTDFDAFCMKPLRMQELSEIIQQVFLRRRRMVSE